MAEGLAFHFEVLLHHWDVKALAVPALVPLDLPPMDLEMQTILDTCYRGVASAGLCLVPLYCLCHLPLPAHDMLVPWLQMLPQCALLSLWKTTVIGLVWK